MEIKREHQINFWYLILAFLAVIWIQSLFFQSTHIKTIPYSEFQQLAAQGKLTDIVVGQAQITGTFKEPADKSVPHFATNRVDPGLAETLTKNRLIFSGEPGPGLFETVLSWLMPALGFVLIWMFLVRPMAGGQGMGGMMAVGRSKAKIFVEKDIKTSFADVAGVDEPRRNSPRSSPSSRIRRATAVSAPAC
jgi:cell division protease FtsH